ncbi:MAG: outer membrane beta-barrel protein, partial [Bacteroides sp.]|nr:outer membrane beta-barrel protein [Bacteroides sp.]
MRSLPLLIVLLLISLQAFSQKEMAKNLPAFDLKRLHFGFTIGINTMDVALDRNYAATDFVYADLTRLQPGFQVTVVSDLRLNQNWNLRFLPGISFGAREISYYDFDPNAGTPPTTSEAIHTVPLSAGFLEFPLLFKYRSQRVNNYR